jgi:hypothetical protein
MCPLCGVRKAKRFCPALRQTICAVCCGTKRLTEIRCPDSCSYLTSSREHPAAVTVRQQRGDVVLLTQAMQDLSERQARLLVALCTFTAEYQPPEFQRLVDVDVQEAAAALAATLETASRGLIYQHSAPSGAARRLSNALGPLLDQAIKGGGSSAERDAAVALRHFEQMVKTTSAAEDPGSRAFVDLLVRMVGRKDAGPEPQASRLIVP